MKKIAFIFALISCSFLVATKHPAPVTTLIFADRNHAEQAAAQAHQVAATGQPVIIIPNITQAWMQWQLQQAHQQQEDEPGEQKKG